MPQRFHHLATLRLFLAMAVISFFFISGFLVTMSWHNLQNPIVFAIHRVFRIFPALFFALIFSVLLAMILSSAPLEVTIKAAIDYVMHNAILIKGIIYNFPGVFEQLPIQSLNGSLWTLEWEVYSYMALFLIGLFGMLSNQTISFALSIFILVIVFITSQTDMAVFRNNPDVAKILFSFVLGNVSYTLYQKYGGRRLWQLHFTLAIIFSFAGSLFYPLIFIFLAAGVVSLISFDSFLPPGDFKHDLSYGVYIFAFPIQQTIVFFNADISPFENFIMTLPFVLLLAAASWFLIEKRFITHGKNLGKRIQTKYGTSQNKC